MRPKHRTVRLPEAVEDPCDDVQVGAIHVGHMSPRQDPPQLCLDRRSTFLPAPAVPVILILDLADPRPDEPEATGREGGAHDGEEGPPFPGQPDPDDREEREENRAVSEDEHHQTGDRIVPEPSGGTDLSPQRGAGRGPEKHLEARPRFPPARTGKGLPHPRRAIEYRILRKVQATMSTAPV